MAKSKETPARKTAKLQATRFTGTMRRASDVTILIECSEKDWKKATPKEVIRELPIGEEALTDQEARVYLGNIGGTSTKAFCVKTKRMLQKMVAFGLRPIFEGDAFWLKVEVIRTMEAKKLVALHGSNSVLGDTHEICIWFDSGSFYLGDIKQECIFEAESWSEFDDLLKFVPIFFNSKLSNGRLQMFDWEKYYTITSKKYKKQNGTK